jgi:integrase
VKLTDATIRTAVAEPGKRLELRDDAEPGLILRVTDGGIRSWSVRYRNAAGEQRRKSLGRFPAIGLARARQLAREAKGETATGTDVVALERARKAEERRQRLHTFSGLAPVYFAACRDGLHRGGTKSKPKRETTIHEEERIFKTLVEPELGKTSIGKLSRIELQAFVSRVAKVAPSNGRHVRNVVRQLLSYAVHQDIIQANIALGVSAPVAGSRERVLDEDELRALWHAWERPGEVEGLKVPHGMGVALRLAAVTLARRSEIMGARWAEFDLKSRVWTIPAERMKGKRAHVIPLNAIAMDILDEAKATIAGREYVFQAPRLEDDAAMDSRRLSAAMRATVAALGMKDATPHDLRRSGATYMTSERCGIPRFIVSQCLAHASDAGGGAAVTGVYDRNDYLPEKRRALDAWGALFREITTGETRPSNVITLAR